MRYLIEWPENQSPPLEILEKLVHEGAVLSELPQTKHLAIPGWKLTNAALEVIIDASLSSKSSPKEEVLQRIAGKLHASQD